MVQREKVDYVFFVVEDSRFCVCFGPILGYFCVV